MPPLVNIVQQAPLNADFGEAALCFFNAKYELRVDSTMNVALSIIINEFLEFCYVSMSSCVGPRQRQLLSLKKFQILHCFISM